MRSVLLATLRTQARRYVAAGAAVAAAVAFLVVTDAITSAARDGMVAGLEVPYAGADAVVDRPSTETAMTLLDRAGAHDADAWMVGWSLQRVVHDGAVLDERADVGVLPEDDGRLWLRLEDGRLPAAGETVVDVNAATSAGVDIGDRVEVGTGDSARDLEIVGVVDSPSMLAAADLYVGPGDIDRWQDSLYVSSVAWAGPGGVDEETDTVAALAGDADVMSVDAFVRMVQVEANQGVDLIAIVLTLFGSLALFVSALVIANTFSILFAQRSRDLALVRCVGATRRQLLRAMRVEALLLGAAAALVGVVAGAAIGHGAVGLTNALWDGSLLGEVDLSTVRVVGAFALGVLATWAASWLPTRRVARIRPLRALRPVEGLRVRSAAGVARIALGTGLLAIGTLGLVGAVATSVATVLVVGGAVTFLGVLVLGPVIVPALIRGAGRALGRFGVPVRLAAANAVRNPRRTAATTAALLVGVTLTVAVLTGLASSRAAVATEMDRQHPVDATITAAGGELTTSLLADVRRVPGVAAAAAVPGVVAEVSDGIGELVVLGRPADDRVARAEVRAPGPGRIRLPRDLVPDDGRVRVTVGGSSVDLRATGVEGYGAAGLVAPGTLSRLTSAAAAPTIGAIWVHARDGADPEDLTGDLTALASGAEVTSGLSRRAYVDLQFDVLTGTVVALLGIAVAIALVGIANTLGLSVIERSREHALLRALGLGRRQLRRMLAAEGALLSLVATALGGIIGVVFAWTGVLTLVRPIAADASLVLPWVQLGAVVVAAGVAGLLAAMLPARRAVRVTPAAGLAVE